MSRPTHIPSIPSQFTWSGRRSRRVLAGILGTICLGSSAVGAGERVATLRPSGANDTVAATHSSLVEAVKAQPITVDTSPEAAAAITATLSYPYGIAVDISGQIYVTNLFGGVNIYSPSTFKVVGAISAGVNSPAAVAVSFAGNVYVANNGGNNVTIYNSAQTQIGTIPDSTLVSPTSLYIDRDDTTWVLDAQGTLHAYLLDGTTLASTHTGGNTVGPWGPNVTVWGAANSSGGYDEAYENRAQAAHTGPSLDNVYVGGSPYAGGEAEDQYAQEYVSDPLHNQVQIWSRNGAYRVGTIDTPAAPYGVAVDSKLNRVYVVMTTLNEVYVYSTIAPYKLLRIIH